MKNGQKVVVAYFAVFLLMPSMAQVLFESELPGIYWVVPPNLYAIGSACIVLAATLILTFLNRRRPVVVKRHGLAWGVVSPLARFYGRHRLALSIVGLILALAYFSAGFMTFRYMALRISDQNSALLLAGNVLSIWILIDLTYQIFANLRQTPSARQRLGNLVLATAFLVATNGTASSLLALAFLGFALSPTLFYRAVFAGQHKSVFQQGAKAGGVLLLAGGLFLVAWVSGEAIKIASSGTKDLITAVGDVVEETRSDTAQNYFYYLVSSLSTHYLSHTYTAATPRTTILQDAPWPLGLPLETFWFRIGYLVGANPSRPEVGSFSRLNYVLLTAEPVTDKQGTSPGLLSAFTYALGRVFGPIACIAYGVWLCSFLDRLVGPGRTLTSVGAVLLLGVTLFLFQSPFDMLSVFDNTTITLLGMIGIATFGDQSVRQDSSVVAANPNGLNRGPLMRATGSTQPLRHARLRGSAVRQVGARR